MAPELFGLVMAGGASTRMGHDKGALVYRSEPQYRLLYHWLQKLCLQAYVSARPDQATDPEVAWLVDRLPGGGPLSGIEAAFSHRSDVAWLVVACDLPLLDLSSLERLVAARDPLRDLTAYRSPWDGVIEPMVAIWEPSMYSRIEQAMASRNRSLRRLCAEVGVRLVEPARPEELMNANTPEAFARARRLLGTDVP